MAQFDDKVVMITGAAGGIAKGIIHKFATDGAKLVLVDSSGEGLKARIDELSDVLNDYIIVRADLGKPEDANHAVRQAEEQFGQIDALIHTVGGWAGGSPVHETDISVFENQIYLNTRILFVTLGRVAKHMVDKEIKGSIVAILAKTGLAGAKDTAAYAASKAAAQRIMESMAMELKEYHIRVNGVMPSIADTPANRQAMPNADFSRWVTPEQIADTMAFLASDAANAITGQALGIYNSV